jgi:orotidine-5'-phosphate decarboxylase
MLRIRPTHVLDGALDRLDGRPWVCDCRSWDIPNTIAAMVSNAPAGMVAISLRPYGAGMIAAAERAARRRGVRIIWVPIGRDIRGGNDTETNRIEGQQ